MALTEFGKVIRKARIDAGETLLSMSEAIGVSPSFLSGMETGRKKISGEWVKIIDGYFKKKEIEISNLQEIALVSNQAIPVEGLPLKQQMLLAGFAKSTMQEEQLQEFARLLESINDNNETNKSSDQ